MNGRQRAGWSKAALGELAEYLNGAAFRPSDRTPDGLPIIRIQNLTDPSKPFNRTRRSVDPRLLVQPGDLLFSWSATLDAFLWAGEPAWLNQHIFKVIPNRAVVDPKFLFFLLKREATLFTESEHVHGSTMRHINRGPFLAHVVDLPPLDEQHRIVEQLTALVDRTGRLRDEIGRLNVLVTKFRARSIEAPFAEGLAGGWPLFKLGDLVCDARIGLIRSKSLQSASGGYPYIRMQHYDSLGRWNLRDVSFVDATPTEAEEYSLRPGDVLFNTRNSVELVGKVAIWRSNERERYLYNNNLLRLRFKPTVYSEFVRWALLANPAARLLEDVKSATTSVAAIYQRDLMRALIPLPGLAVQRQIASTISAAANCADQIDEQVMRTLALASPLERRAASQILDGELLTA